MDEGEASLKARDVEVEDYHTVANAFQDGPSVPATVSFDVRWHGVTRRVKTRDTTNDFGGTFVENTATIAWSAREAGFSFVSDAAATSHSTFAEIGRERNGRFFP